MSLHRFMRRRLYSAGLNPYIMCSQVAADRASVITALGFTPAEGKEKLVSILNGGQVPEGPKEDAFLLNLSNEGRLLRWISVGLRKSVHAELCEEKGRRCAPEMEKLKGGVG